MSEVTILNNLGRCKFGDFINGEVIINYRAVVYYFHSVQWSMHRPINKQEDAKLIMEADAVSSHWSGFGNNYLWNVVAPTDRCLKMINDMGARKPNYVEMARDLEFDNWFEGDICKEFHDMFWCEPWHGNKEMKYGYDLEDQEMTNTTTYSGQKQHKSKFAWYQQYENRHTGEIYRPRFHVEMRARGREVIKKKMGIDCTESMIGWTQEEHESRWLGGDGRRGWLEYRDVDLSALGRKHRNMHARVKKRGFLIEKFDNGYVYDKDLRVGGIILRAYSVNEAGEYLVLGVQNVLDVYGRVNNIFPEIEVEWRKGRGANIREREVAGRVRKSDTNVDSGAHINIKSSVQAIDNPCSQE
jgi:hypothetical protein